MKLRLVWYSTMAVMAYGLLGANQCPPKPPTPTPTPTPPPAVDVRPTSPVYLDLLLRTTPQGQWLRNGQPHEMVGAIPCWTPDNPDGSAGPLVVDGKVIPYWWSLFSKEWVDHTKTKGVNAVHVRLGPVRAVDQCCGLQEVGGPYAEVSALQLRKLNRKLRLATAWNQKYWDRVHQVLHHAGRQGFNVQVSIVDGWTIKHATWGEFSMPWPASDVVTALSMPLNASVTDWVKKVVYETCSYGHVFYEVGNETSLGPGWTPQWERAIYQLIRAEEAQCGVVHVVNSNTRDFSGPYEAFSTHDGSPIAGPEGGRPVIMNEVNPALHPATFKARRCASAAVGQSYWYWRSDGSNEWQDQSLQSIKDGCAASGACPDPQPLPVSTFACKWTGQWYDCTPQQHSCEQCAAIGMGEYQGTIRCDCPVRNECPDTPGYEGLCQERATCEKVAMGGYPVWRGDAQVSINVFNENRLQARCDGCTTLTICAADGTTGCTKIF